jgi:hypothetical protein
MSGVAMVVGSCGNFEISQLIYLRESFWRSYNLFFSSRVITGTTLHIVYLKYWRYGDGGQILIICLQGLQAP